jgi:hypothetical protein
MNFTAVAGRDLDACFVDELHVTCPEKEKPGRKRQGFPMPSRLPRLVSCRARR